MKVFLIAGERSGDFLGAKLIAALRHRDRTLSIAGVGGEAMMREGLTSLFPMTELAVMGFGAVIARLPSLMQRIDETARAAVAFQPDVSSSSSTVPTSPTASRARCAPSRETFRSSTTSVRASGHGGRDARAPCAATSTVCWPSCRFEPSAYVRLNGPPCEFVGHPLVEHITELTPNPEEAAARKADVPTFLLMPGSRNSEIKRLMPIFGRTLSRLAALDRPFEVILPTLPTLEHAIRTELESWPVKPQVIVGDPPKLAAMRRARAALVASGTATLELALARVPMVVAYRVSAIESLARFLDRRAVDRPGQSDPGRKRHPRIRAGGLHAAAARDGPAAPGSERARPVTPDRRVRTVARLAHAARWACAERSGRAGRGGLRGGRSDVDLSAWTPARSRAAVSLCRAGAAGQSSGPGPLSFRPTARSNPPCGPARTTR